MSPTLPPIPSPDPTVPMPDSDKRLLVQAMLSRKGQMLSSPVWAEVQDGYARLWCHLCATHGIKPGEVLDKRDAEATGLLGAWLEPSIKLDLHQHYFLERLAPDIAKRANGLWETARIARNKAAAGEMVPLFAIDG